MLGTIQSDSTGPGRQPTEGRNATSPSGKGREGVEDLRGYGGSGKGGIYRRGTSGV